MDLIALANDTGKRIEQADSSSPGTFTDSNLFLGEVTVQRFKWDMPIKIVAPEEKLRVRSIAWRMDEKILGIAYNNGLIVLVDIETKEEIHSIRVEKDIKTICWTQNIAEIDESERFILESHKTYLAPLPNTNSITTSTKKPDYDSSKFYSKNMLNFLLIACVDGKIHVYIFGVLSCGTIDVRRDIGATAQDKVELIDVKLSTTFKQLFVIFSINDNVEMLIYENETLLKYHVSLWKLSVKYGMVLNILGYIDDTIQNIIEAWETVLLEMDNKLTKYAKTQAHGAVSADFLELLMFGYPSEALGQFLTRDLTEKELKKLGNSIDLSYGTILKLVVKPLHNAIISMFYHLNHINGMHQNGFYFKDLLGEVSNDTLTNTGAFLIKSYELQQTVDKSMQDYKIFFRWLYIAISRLLDENVPDDIGSMTQQEPNYLAEFLYNLEENREESVDATGEKEIKFNLERVGQYLEDKNLIIPPPNDDTSMWEQLLASNECLRSSKTIYPHHKSLSLIQQKNLMRKSIDELFGRLETTVGANFKLQLRNNFNMSSLNNKIITSYEIDGEDDAATSMFTILMSENCLLFLVCTSNSQIKTVELKFLDRSECQMTSIGQLSFIDVKFYSPKLVSVMMRNQVDTKCSTCFMQLPVGRINDGILNSSLDIVTMDAYTLIDDSTFKMLEGFNGATMAVSGSRKVSAFLATNMKTVRLYDMENDDDEPDDFENSNNNSFDAS